MAILLTKSDVQQVLDMKSTIEAVEAAFLELHKQTAQLPQRTPIVVSEHEGVALFMPSFVKDIGALGAKVVTVYKNNPKEHDLPTVMGVIILLDKRTGEPLAIMDGGFLTAMRTGCVSGIATRYMARKDAKIGAIVGTGIQARTQVWAMCEAHQFERILAFSVDPPEKIDQFCDEAHARLGIPFDRAESCEAAVREADVLTLATSAKDPIIDGDWLKPGCHINGIGSHAPVMRELDDKTVTRARIICDQTSACLAEAGDFLIPMKEGKLDKDMIAGDLGAVIAGDIPGRTNDEEITLFKSVGLAIQDISTAWAVYTRAMEVGTEFDFMAEPEKAAR